jgi:protein-disulfide isomerase
MRRLHVALSLCLTLVLVPAATSSADEAQDSKEMAGFVRDYEALPIVDVPRNTFDAVRGRDFAPVRVVVFSDFQCRPYCKRGADIAEKLRRSYGEYVQIVFKNYPLSSSCNPATSTNMHPYACGAALGAQCALEQGQFWPFHDGVFDTEQLDDGTFERVATEVGLDMTAWRSCLESGRPAEQVATHARQGEAVKVTGTPSWVVNGRKLSGSFASKLDAVVRWELVQAGIALPMLSEQ